MQATIPRPELSLPSLYPITSDAVQLHLAAIGYNNVPKDILEEFVMELSDRLQSDESFQGNISSRASSPSPHILPSSSKQLLESPVNIIQRASASLSVEPLPSPASSKRVYPKTPHHGVEARKLAELQRRMRSNEIDQNGNNADDRRTHVISPISPTPQSCVKASFQKSSTRRNDPVSRYHNLQRSWNQMGFLKRVEAQTSRQRLQKQL